MTSSLGINDSRPRNLESPRVPNLLPEQVRLTAEVFVGFLEEYYKFLNTSYSYQTGSVSAVTQVDSNTFTITDYTKQWTKNQLENSTFYASSGMASGIHGAVAKNPAGSSFTFTLSSSSKNEIPTVGSSYILIIPPNSGIGKSQASNALYTLKSDFDLDEIMNPTYLAHIQSAIAPYVPVPNTKYFTLPDSKLPYFTSVRGRAELYKKVVRYYYNTRGSRDSVAVFFQLFFGTIATTLLDDQYSIDLTAYIRKWLNDLLSAAGYPYSASSKTIAAWIPYSYVIATAVPQEDFDASYLALVHPIGMKYYSLLTGVLSQIFEISDSRMERAKYDYQNPLWLIDVSPISEFATFTIADAASNYNPTRTNTSIDADGYGYSYAEWSNIGALLSYLQSDILGFVNYSYLTSPNSLSNIVIGMSARNITAPSALSSSAKVQSKSYVNVEAIGKSTASSNIIEIPGGNSNIIPGIFVSGSGIANKTYVISSTLGAASDSFSGYAYINDTTFAYSGSSLNTSLNVGANVTTGSLFNAGTITQINSPVTPKVIYTFATSAVISGSTMLLKVGKLGPISSSSINALPYIASIWNSGSNMVYVTGGNNTFGNYNSSSAYVYVSNIDIPTQQITLRKSNGTAFTAISTGSGSTVGYGIANSNVIIFTDIAPGSVVITQDAKTGGAGFGGGVSYPAGWYRATYYGGAIKVTGTATSTPSGLAMAINSALGLASWTPPIRV